jgi:hypothetical protein
MIQNVTVNNAPQAEAPNNEVSSDEEGEAEARNAGSNKPIKRRRTSECGYTIIQLKKMTTAQRTKFSRKHGTLVGLCGSCGVDWRPVREDFVPDVDSEMTMRRASDLKRAVEDYENAYAADDAYGMEEALAVVLKKRTSYCRPCQDAVNSTLSPKVLACKNEWERMKREACATHGGCPKPGCAEGGMAAWVCMSADHVDPTTTVHALSHYKWWSSNGGVEAMRREHEKVQWMCVCCHQYEPTSATGRTRTGTFPSWERIREKEAYVNAHKLKLAQCQYADCPRVVTAATVRSFDLDHRDPRTKAMHETHPELIAKARIGGGVGGIVQNSATSLAEVKAALDEELAKCDLLCTNCHTCRKPKRRGRWDAS